MFCKYCGVEINDESICCKHCGVNLNHSNKENIQSNQFIGYSNKINDPAFAKYLKNSKRYSLIFAIVLAIISTVGFGLYGTMNDDLTNPMALFIGLGVGFMFILIAIFQNISNSKSETWDGMVVDKMTQHLRRTQSNGSTDSDYYFVDYTEYCVVIRAQNGKLHYLRVEDNDYLYNYYNIGDYVRFHGGLNTYEKYDKSKDSIIFCNACGSLNKIEDEYCYRCKCPLLK